MATSLLISTTPHQVLPELAAKIGINEALFLQQLHWLISNNDCHTYEGREWYTHSVDQWLEKFPYWSEKTFRRTITSLDKQGLIFQEKLHWKVLKIRGNTTKWYAVNYEQVEQVSIEAMKEIKAKKQAKLKAEKEKNTSSDPVISGTGQNDQTGIGHFDQVTTGQNDQTFNKINKEIYSKSVNNTRETKNFESEQNKQSFSDKVMTELHVATSGELSKSKRHYAQLKIQEYKDRFPSSESVADCWAYVVQAINHQYKLTGS